MRGSWLAVGIVGALVIFGLMIVNAIAAERGLP